MASNPLNNVSLPPIERDGIRLLIAVIGGSEVPPTVRRNAGDVGQKLAERGAIVVCGGHGGVMEAVCKGAKLAGGVTVGILPGSDPRGANPYVDIPTCTGIGYARNVAVIKSGRAVIALHGSYGTLSEIGLALADGTPVVGLGTWEHPLLGKDNPSFGWANSPAEAVELAITAARLRIL